MTTLTTKTTEQDSPSLQSRTKSFSDKSPLAEQSNSRELVLNTDSDALFFRQLENQKILLNKQQIEAVRTTEGALYVIAGPGSGKTTTLVCRVGYLISVKKVNPKNILLVTFTKKASINMKNRITRFSNISQTQTKLIVSGTFHSIFYKILRTFGYGEYRILNSEAQKSFLVRKALNISGVQEEWEESEILQQISLAKNSLILPEQNEHQDFPKNFFLVYQAYEQLKEQEKLMDYDDMLVWTYQLLQRDNRLLKQLQTRFDYILVDEYQDTNKVQKEIIALFAEQKQNICVVGDDDQSIYSFRGANHEYILSFPDEYKRAKRVTLETNYRSSDYIVGLSSKVIKKNRFRYQKNLKATYVGQAEPHLWFPSTETEEASLIVDWIKEQLVEGTIKPNNIAILYRTHQQAKTLFEVFVDQDVPFYIAQDGEFFYDRSMVKIMLNWLKLAINPDDLTALEIILPSLFLSRQLLPLIQGVAYTRQISYLEAITLVEEIPSYQKRKLIERITVIKSIASKSPVEAIQLIRDKGELDKWVAGKKSQSLSLEKELWLDELDGLAEVAKEYPTIEVFLQKIDRWRTQFQQMKTEQNPDEAVQMMTIHRSKGLEFDTVFVIGLVENMLPFKGAIFAEREKKRKKPRDFTPHPLIEEERRLLYVAMTRAKNHLVLTAPDSYQGKNSKISRFISDLDNNYERHNKENIGESKADAIWQCEDCIAWRKIDSKLELEKAKQLNQTIPCPLCGGKMNLEQKS